MTHRQPSARRQPKDPERTVKGTSMITGTIGMVLSWAAILTGLGYDTRWLVYTGGGLLVLSLLTLAFGRKV